ncbi:Hypp6713 [Branchiostoma lanceolatum]|uniref:Hypp6713 protein n=1 Tax=Branchiostoma lanceolatum TaxID=7740 RepID=A0A8J9YVI8_BRALA|nr:Hypp6713 [Branchiostoma lanceolatum]
MSSNLRAAVEEDERAKETAAKATVQAAAEMKMRDPQAATCAFECEFPEKVTVDDVLTHLKTTCPHVKVACPNEGCTTHVPREGLQSHRDVCGYGFDERCRCLTEGGRANTYEDITDGRQYKKIKELREPNNMSLLMNTDGVRIFKSSPTNLLEEELALQMKLQAQQHSHELAMLKELLGQRRLSCGVRGTPPPTLEREQVAASSTAPSQGQLEDQGELPLLNACDDILTKVMLIHLPRNSNVLRTDHTILAVHIPVLAPELFDSRKLQDYTYEVIGGNHTRLALQKLHSEDPDEDIFKTTMARVYCDLPDSLARKVGIDHNKIQFALPPSAAGRLFSFRAAAYAEAGYTDEADLTTVEPLLMKDKESRWMDGLITMLYVKGTRAQGDATGGGVADGAGAEGGAAVVAVPRALPRTRTVQRAVPQSLLWVRWAVPQVVLRVVMAAAAVLLKVDPEWCTCGHCREMTRDEERICCGGYPDSYGASVMSGRNNGLVALLLEEIPYLLYSHCGAHKLELAALDGMKDEVQMKKVLNILTAKLRHIPTYLAGPAFSYYTELPDATKADLALLRAAMVGPFGRPQLAANARPRRPAESISVYAADVQRQVRLAFPAFNDAGRAHVALDRFLAGVDPDLKIRVMELSSYTSS